MEAQNAARLLALLRNQPVAALGTLHNGDPAVSMAPYAVLSAAGSLVIHVSRLATHTDDMLAHPAVSLMVTAVRETGVPPQALARVTFRASAAPIDRTDPGHRAARDAYLARFPETEPLFGLGDFALFAIVPRNARYVGGFGQAATITSKDLRALLAQA